MKLTALLLIMGALHVGAAGFSQRITFSAKSASLETVLSVIKEQTGYVVFCNYELLKRAKPVSIAAHDWPLEVFMRRVLDSQALDFVIKDKTVVIERKTHPLTVSGNPLPEFIVFPITGIITDTKGVPLAGINISVVGSNEGTVTDASGKFSINAGPGAVLLISSAGFQSREWKLTAENQTSPLTIQLVPKITDLDTASVVVSTGYQTLSKERSTGSFVQIDRTMFNRRVSPDVIGRLEGVVPGLLFNRNTFNSASGLGDISIRGNSTMYAGDQPLIVVDGFAYEGDVANLNPNTVESITVLKDAAAASIWGVRSGNGVIVITTKTGSRNQSPKIEFNTNLTTSSRPDLYYNKQVLPSTVFIDLEQELFKRGFYDGDLISSRPTTVSPVIKLLADARSGILSAASAEAQINALRSVDIRDDLSAYFYRRAFTQQYSLGIQGGGNSNDYFINAGYDKTLSDRTRNDNDRITINSQYNFQVFKGLTLSAGMHYTQSAVSDNNTAFGIKTGSYDRIYPYAQLAGDQGQALSIIKNYPSAFTDTAGGGKLLDWRYRPLDDLQHADNTSKTTDYRLLAGLKYRFPKYLTASLNYQYQRMATAENDYFDTTTYRTRDMINRYTQIDGSGNVTYPIPVGGILEQSGSLVASHNVRGQLDFQHKSGKGEWAVITGAEVRETIREKNYNTLYGYNPATLSSNTVLDFKSNFNLRNGTSAQIPNTLSLYKTTNNFISYYANGSYTYLSRYTLSASGRIDKSNLFGVSTNQKAVPLYSAGLSWNISKEPFYAVPWMPLIKLRVTYGYNGNINTGATAQTTIREFTGNRYSPIPYDMIINPGNPELRWEKIRMINLGVDYALLNHRISGSLEYFFKRGQDLFGYSPIEPSSGLSSIFGNNADISGRGFDIQVNTKNIVGKRFTWSTQLLLSRANDIVTGYGTSSSPSSYIGSSSASSVYPLEGKSLYGIYSYRFAGLSEKGDPQGYLPDGRISTDYNAIMSGTNLENMQYHGSARPEYFGAVRNTVTYKSISLSANIIYKLKYAFRRYSYTSSGLPWLGHEDYFNRWQKPGDERITTIPALAWPPYNLNRESFYSRSSTLVEQGDHIRLQDISLSYQWTRPSGSRFPFPAMQLYSYVNNLGILWRANKADIDPDLIFGSNLGSYPMPVTFSLGLKVTF